MNKINNRGITVLSLCDGMSSGQIALKELGIPVKRYFAAEIKDIAIKVTKDNFPDTIFVGDVNKINYCNGVLYTEHGNYQTDIDIVMFGSPCQTFSVAMPTKHRVGLDNKEKSGLFFECYRILQEVNPRYFLMENVRSMKNKDKDYISYLLGVEPIMIDSALVSPCIRKRYYWTNIPNVNQPKAIDIKLQDILESGYTNREKGHCLMVVDCRPLTTPVKMFHRYYYKGFNNLVFKSEQHYKECCEYYDSHYRGMKAKDIPVGETDVFNGVRFLTQTELEKSQTAPVGYTKCLTRNEAADVLGDGWTIEVIKHILKGLITDEQTKETIYTTRN